MNDNRNECDRFLDMINREMDGELTPPEALLLEEHLASCEECRSARDDMARISEAVRLDEAMFDVPGGFADGVMGMLAEEGHGGESYPKSGKGNGDDLMKSNGMMDRISGWFKARAGGVAAVAAIALVMMVAYSLSTGDNIVGPSVQKSETNGPAYDRQTEGSEGSADSITGDYDASEPQAKNPDSDSPSGDKIVKNATMEMNVVNVKESIGKVESSVGIKGGYVDSMRTYYDEDSESKDFASAYMVLRIPSAKLQDIMVEIAGFGEEKSRALATQNITGTYEDTAASLKNLKNREESLRELQKKAESFEDILRVDEAITAVRNDIESLERIIRDMDKQVEYSMLTLQMTRAKPDMTLVDKIVNGLLDSVSFIGGVFMKAVYVVAFAVPYVLASSLIYFAWTRMAPRFKGKD